MPDFCKTLIVLAVLPFSIYFSIKFGRYAWLSAEAKFLRSQGRS